MGAPDAGFSGPSSRSRARRGPRAGVGAAGLALGALGVFGVDGVGLWPLLGLGVVGILALLGAALPGVLRPTALANSVLLVLSVSAALTLVEVAHWAVEAVTYEPLPAAPLDPEGLPPPPELPPEIERAIRIRHEAVVLHADWKQHDLPREPGMRRQPYFWHGVYHGSNADSMRHDGPFPPRDPRRFRILVVGDSFTYGSGIASDWTYAAQLERALAPDFRVEVLNLGVQGNQSEDTVAVVRRFVPELEADFLVYGVTLNDFLPSRTDPTLAYPFPLPRKWKRKLQRRTRAGRLISESYDGSLRRLGLRPDFYGEMLADFESYRQRFARDVRELNAIVVGHGLPPAVGVVLDPFPRVGSPGHELAMAAEQAMREAGMQVAGSARYYARYEGANFGVSRWENHPNEKAAAIWAARLAEEIRATPGLAPFRRSTAGTRG